MYAVILSGEGQDLIILKTTQYLKAVQMLSLVARHLNITLESTGMPLLNGRLSSEREHVYGAVWSGASDMISDLCKAETLPAPEYQIDLRPSEYVVQRGDAST